MHGPATGEETTKRRKRKWDQPDESLVSANITIPGLLPLSNMGLIAGSGISVAASGTISANPLTAFYVRKPDASHTMLMPMQAAAVVQKLTQSKIQEELIIAREIVINDAEPAVRYKLTKRQTQEEIQKCTGAVVITRGKYRPPNGMPDGDKPLYLHISAGAHLADTAERIMAVDRAAAMVEEMLKPVSKVYSTCVYLGYDADPSLDIPTRIRGPNDQYINHIISETGATISIQGRGSGNAGTNNVEEGDQHQPLHLLLSSNNPKALVNAKRLAENLLDTISRECGISRALPNKVYTAVPPPQELLRGSLCPGIAPISIPSSTCISTLVAPVVANQSTDGFLSLSTGAGTSYSGYSGIYPQATPLQQVAQALRESCGMNCASAASTITKSESRPIGNSPLEKDRRAPHKRKFQEFPAATGGSRSFHQDTESVEWSSRPITVADKPLRDLSLMPPPKKPINLPSGVMLPPPPPPPPRTSVINKPAVSSPPRSKGMMMPIPPPAPPKVNYRAGKEDNTSTSKSETVPDTLVKLLEYGEDDDSDNDDENNSNEDTLRSSVKAVK